MSTTAKTASQITEPGAYQWIDRTGAHHVGFIVRDRGGRLNGSFIGTEGNTRAVSLHADDDTGNGTFYGPIQLPI